MNPIRQAYSAGPEDGGILDIFKSFLQNVKDKAALPKSIADSTLGGSGILEFIEPGGPALASLPIFGKISKTSKVMNVADEPAFLMKILDEAGSSVDEYARLFKEHGSQAADEFGEAMYETYRGMANSLRGIDQPVADALNAASHMQRTDRGRTIRDIFMGVDLDIAPSQIANKVDKTIIQTLIEMVEGR